MPMPTKNTGLARLPLLLLLLPIPPAVFFSTAPALPLPPPKPTPTLAATSKPPPSPPSPPSPPPCVLSFLLSIDEGIVGYRDGSLETVKQNSVDYELPLEIYSYKVTL